MHYRTSTNTYYSAKSRVIGRYIKNGTQDFMPLQSAMYLQRSDLIPLATMKYAPFNKNLSIPDSEFKAGYSILGSTN